MSNVEPYGTSTVALSAYNVLAMKAAPASGEELLQTLVMIQHPELTPPLLARALGRLVEMGVVARDGDQFRSLGKPRRIVVGRDISDAVVNHETGELEGGWNNWVARDPERGLMPFSEVTR